MATKTINRPRGGDRRIHRSVSVEQHPLASEKAQKKPPPIPESLSLEVAPTHDVFGEDYPNIFAFMLSCIEEPFGKVTPVDMTIFNFEIRKVEYEMLLKLQVYLYRKLIYYDENDNKDDITLDTNLEILRDQIEMIEAYIKEDDTFNWFCDLIEDMLNAGCASDIEEARVLLLSDLFNLEIIRVDPRLYDEPIIYSNTTDYTPDAGFVTTK